MGIALFFALTSFVPPFRSTGFDPTFAGFQLAGTAGQVTCLFAGLLFFVRDPMNGWPFLAAAFCFPLNDAIYSMLTALDLIDPLTGIIGSMSQPLTFVASFTLLFSLLAVTALPRPTGIPGSPVGVATPAA
jgi:hypothetical protein